MVKFILRIFKSCQTKHSSPPRQRHNELTGESPCKVHASPLIPTPHRSSFNPFRFPSLPVPPFYDKKTRHTKPKAYSHRFSTTYNMDDEGEHDQPHRSLSDVGLHNQWRTQKMFSWGSASGHNNGGDGEVSPEWGSPARLSVFKKLMSCEVEGKVKESFAVVKKSEKPYEDFKTSMMEMIVENQMYEESDLKQLLECFLSLNSWYHHGVIMQAFSEIWNTVFVDR
ncbi:transcription repressor OFP2-like [Bidens hawaiensis]|uniref:transcription repressor OFP2-like n=1 Tax=Bidens hawaiensis TaxID=980011 RepID=UPI0040495E84